MNIEYVKDLKALFNALKYVEVVVFPAGEEGNNLLDYLYYTERSGRVRCVISEDGDSPNRFVHNLPIIPINVMPHFRATATVIVAAPSDKSDELIKSLTNLGFQMVLCLTDELHEILANELTKINAPDNMTSWLMNRVAVSMDAMEYSLSVQEELSELNTAAFEQYRGACSGKKVVVCGCGPTLKYYEPIPDAVHISLNRAFLNDNIKFDFLIAHDPGGGSKIPSIATSFDKISERVFLGKPIVQRSGVGYSEWFSTAGDKVKRYFKGYNNVGQPIWRDICNHPLTDFWSIFSSGIELAFFMNPAEIYLVGCDCSVEGHFYYFSEADSTKYWLNTPVVHVGYSRLKLFGKQYYPNTKFKSINPVGLKELFEDIYTDEY
ncbi:MAG: hypothetical protein IJU71_11995, partial [Selenomonadaceae bacterium]|nr:hypothetical protein [Selenomonadaceae bacterium]